MLLSGTSITAEIRSRTIFPGSRFSLLSHNIDIYLSDPSYKYVCSVFCCIYGSKSGKEWQRVVPTYPKILCIYLDFFSLLSVP
jgi:hypothetical protein